MLLFYFIFIYLMHHNGFPFSVFFFCFSFSYLFLFWQMYLLYGKGKLFQLQQNNKAENLNFPLEMLLTIFIIFMLVILNCYFVVLKFNMVVTLLIYRFCCCCCWCWCCYCCSWIAMYCKSLKVM